MIEFSTELIEQTKLAWGYLEKAKPIITYMHLVPVNETQIEEYEEKTGKIIPPDYRYWLTQYGSGRIEFIESSLNIPSIYELLEDDDRLVGDQDPANCWKRIYLGYGGTPSIEVLDSTVIDEAGFAPVAVTQVYSNQVERVFSSSWPMFIIKNVIDTTKSLVDRIKEGTEKDNDGNFIWETDDDPLPKRIGKEQVEALQSLSASDFEAIDTNLAHSTLRVSEHNKTILADGDPERFPNSMINFAVELLEAEIIQKNSESAAMPTKEKTYNENNKFADSVAILEHNISLGYSLVFNSSSGFDAMLFIERVVEPRHEESLRILCSHERREMREIALSGLIHILPAEAEKRAKQTSDWVGCAEAWKKLYSNNIEAARCLEEAEKSANDYSDWMRCFKCWLEISGNIIEARRCLCRAEDFMSKSKETLDINEHFLTLADEWFKFGDQEESKRCLSKLVNEDVSVVFLCWGADKWLELFNDKENAAKCLLKAESIAGHSMDWQNCAESWEKLGLEEDQERCLKKAQ
ncbi:MAG: SMI1/KNR4 family protein [Deltaproteobacteria bacterium]|nr:SMI1/KNR4 family protein [Deltaproteobacteria bacterium]